MTKRVRAGLAYLTSLIAVIPTIAAAWSFSNLSQGPRDLIEIIKQFLAPFFEVILNTSQFDPFFFTKVLFIILLFVIIKFVLEKSRFLGMDEKPGISMIVAGVISILAIRFIPQTDLVNLVLLPYNVLGIAILTILPFIVFFFFVEKSNMSTPGRRLTWFFYAVVFGVLWYNRYSDLSPLGNQIYGWVLAVIVLCLIFDPKIKEYFGLHDFSEAKRKKATEKRIGLEARLGNVNKHLETNPRDREAIELKKEIEKSIKLAIKEETS